MNTHTNQSLARKTLCLQKDQSDCGVACLLSMIRYYGGESSLENLRTLSGTGKEGTSLLGLYEAAAKSGFDTEGCEADMDALIEHGEPLVLHLILENKLQHYVVCYGYSGGRFLIGDPGKGLSYYTREELSKVWTSGYCLVLKPSQDFVQSASTRSQKLQWIWFLLAKDLDLLFMAMAIGLVTAILGLVMSLFSQKLIDDILPDKNVEKLMSGLLLLSMLLLVRILLSALRQFLMNRQAKEFNERLTLDFFSKILSMPALFFDTRKTGDFTARLNDSARIQRVLGILLNSFVIDLLVLLVSLPMLYSYDWQTGLFCTLWLPVIWYMVGLFHKPLLDLQKESMQSYAVTESNYIDTIQGISEIRNAGREDYFLEKNQDIYGRYQQKSFELSNLNMRLNLLAGTGSVVFLAGVILLASYQVIGGGLLAGQFMALIGIASSMLPSALNLSLLLIPINEAKVAFDRVFEFSQTPAPDKGDGKIIFEGPVHCLTVSGLSYRFPGRSPLLKGVSLVLEKGSLALLKGESGTGKSTLLSILSQNYAFQEGEILVNHHIHLQDIGQKSWKKQVAVVPQDIKIFNCSLIGNIILTKPDEAEIGRAVDICEKWGFSRYFLELPNNYFTLLGESGVHLSGGQKQMLALARALYQNPRLLLLDEPTSSMDREMEIFVMDLLGRLKQEMPILMISHQENIFAGADRVYRLENKSLQLSV